MAGITFLQKHLKYHNEGAAFKCYYDKKNRFLFFFLFESAIALRTVPTICSVHLEILGFPFAGAY